MSKDLSEWNKKNKGAAIMRRLFKWVKNNIDFDMFYIDFSIVLWYNIITSGGYMNVV